MSSPTETYSCPQCSGHVAYDIPSGTWKCGFCSQTYPKEALESRKTFSTVKEQKSTEEPLLSDISCGACGAHLICEETTAATFCLYCRSPTIIKTRFSGEFKPRYVLPFGITQDQAKKLYFSWIRKKFFAPASFKTAQEVDQIRGLYIPCWLFDSHVMGSVEGEGKNTRSYTSGEYRVTETDHYHVLRAGDARYSRVPVDGSKKLDDSLVLGIEPFDYTQLQDFSMEYMASCLAETYDLPKEEAQTFMEPRVKAYLAGTLESSGRQYGSLSIRSQNIDVSEVQGDYAMLPLYILNNRYGKKNLTFLVNGQTGKVYGQTPVDHLWRLGFTLAMTVAFSLLAVLIGGLINVR